MSVMELEREVLQKLQEHYSEGRVALEPSLSGKKTVYPDIAVFHTEEQVTPLLLIECSRFRTAHRRANDFEEISEAVSSTQAEYGALVSKSAEFVFSGDEPPYKSHAEFPEPNADSTADKRPIQSQAELEFLIERAHIAQNSMHNIAGREHQAMHEFLEYLHLLVEARRQKVPISADSRRDVLSEIQQHISNRYQCYRQKEDLDVSRLSVLSLIFNGYDISETDNNILEHLFDITLQDQRGSGCSTPLGLARQMIYQADLESGDVVLDPAAGRGTILSLLSGKQTSAIGVEINHSMARTATFYSDLFDRKINIFNDDFFDIASDSDLFSEPIDTIIVDPPFNMDVDRSDVPFAEGQGQIHSQDAFLAKSLSLLDQGGSIIITVPSGFLYSHRSKWIRQTILDNFQLDSVIQIIDGPIYQHTSIDTALLKITKESSSMNHAVNYEIIQSPNNPVSELADAVSHVKEGNSDYIKQSELTESFDIHTLTQQKKITEKVEEKFTDTTRLSEIASIHRAHYAETLDEKHENTIRYMSAGDVVGDGSKPESQYVVREEATVVATESDVLILTVGRAGATHIPSEPVAPSHDLAVVSFESPEQALVYETFLNSDLAMRQIEVLESGSNISSIIENDLRDLLVPDFSDIEDRAETIRNHQRKLEELEQKRKRLEREQSQLAGNADSLLSKGDPDE